MGHFTDVYGCIFGRGDCAEANAAAIAALPEHDTWPYVTRDMFAVPKMDYSYQDQLIPFARLYNGVERVWELWLSKFEAVLRTLYWDEVHVHLLTEHWGHYHYLWKPITPSALPPDSLIRPVQHWEFSGGPRTGIRALTEQPRQP